MNYDHLVSSKEVLEDLIEKELPEFRLHHVAGDGLCILQSFKYAMSSALGSELSLEEIEKSLKEEILSNIDFYSSFSDRNIDISLELDSFLNDPLGSYDCDTCDLFLLSLGNAFKCSITVFQSDEHQCWKINLNDPDQKYNEHLYFARSLSLHLDPIVRKERSHDSDIEIIDEVTFLSFYVINTLHPAKLTNSL